MPVTSATPTFPSARRRAPASAAFRLRHLQSLLVPPVGCGESPDWDAEIPLIDADRSLFPATTQLIAVKGQPDQRIVHECAGSGRAVGVIAPLADSVSTRPRGTLAALSAVEGPALPEADREVQAEGQRIFEVLWVHKMPCGRRLAWPRCGGSSTIGSAM